MTDNPGIRQRRRPCRQGPSAGVNKDGMSEVAPWKFIAYNLLRRSRNMKDSAGKWGRTRQGGDKEDEEEEEFEAAPARNWLRKVHESLIPREFYCVAPGLEMRTLRRD